MNRSIAPDGLEKALGALALAMFGFVVVAVARGIDEWARIPGRLCHFESRHPSS
jgi:hypothetical protein